MPLFDGEIPKIKIILTKEFPSKNVTQIFSAMILIAFTCWYSDILGNFLITLICKLIFNSSNNNHTSHVLKWEEMIKKD